MTRNPKIVLLCVLCIFTSGILVSYKSFEIHEKFKKDNSAQMGQEISAWVAESIELKLGQLESSVSYLDKSTVESLKRLGARYFAYAYKKNDVWELKWKVLNDQFAKDQILSEVNAIEFDKVSSLERSWSRSQSGKLIYVAPVGLAKSHQLVSGFLVFGVDKSFFNYIKDLDENLVFIDKNLKSVHQKLALKELKNTTFFDNKNLKAGTHFATGSDEITTFTSYFSPLSQLWIVNQRALLPSHYFSSPYLAYALIGSLLISLLLLVMLSQWGETRKSLSRFVKKDSIAPGLTLIKNNINQFKKSFSKPQMTKSKITEPAIGLIEKDRIGDFSEFLDEVLIEETERLKKLGISIKTRIDEEAIIYCSKKHISDVLKRLIGNSALALEFTDEKEIQIQLVETNDYYQLIYVDSRTEHFPSGHEPSLFLQTEGSMVGIDGIISYAAWLFGKGLHVAKKGFCLSLDLEKYCEDQVSADTNLEVVPFVETLDRIEINDNDTDLSLMNLFAPIQKDLNFIDGNAEGERIKDNLAELTYDLPEDLDFESFELKDFNFKELKTEVKNTDQEKKSEIKTDGNGMFEFNNGQFKIKIRSPKKRDMDVDR